MHDAWKIDAWRERWCQRSSRYRVRRPLLAYPLISPVLLVLVLQLFIAPGNPFWNEDGVMIYATPRSHMELAGVARPIQFSWMSWAPRLPPWIAFLSYPVLGLSRLFELRAVWVPKGTRLDPDWTRPRTESVY